MDLVGFKAKQRKRLLKPSEDGIAVEIKTVNSKDREYDS